MIPCEFWDKFFQSSEEMWNTWEEREEGRSTRPRTIGQGQFLQNLDSWAQIFETYLLETGHLGRIFKQKQLVQCLDFCLDKDVACHRDGEWGDWVMQTWQGQWEEGLITTFPGRLCLNRETGKLSAMMGMEKEYCWVLIVLSMRCHSKSQEGCRPRKKYFGFGD